MTMPYIDPIVKKYMELIEANCPAVIGTFYGEPYAIPASQMPAVFISKVMTEIQPLNNAQDEHQTELRLTLVTDVRKTLDDEKQIVAGISQLYEVMEGRNADYTLTNESIVNVIRSNIHVDTAQNLRTDLGQLTRVDYSDNVRNRAKEWFIEAHINFVCHFIQTR